MWDDSNPTYAYVPCLLPDQLGIYLDAYIPCAVLSLLIVIFTAVMRTRSSDLDQNFIVKLPDPATSSKKPTQTTVVCFGRRRSLRGLGCLFGNKRFRSQSKRGLLRNILQDVADIAIFPISIFIIVNLLISR